MLAQEEGSSWGAGLGMGSLREVRHHPLPKAKALKGNRPERRLDPGLAQNSGPEAQGTPASTLEAIFPSSRPSCLTLQMAACPVHTTNPVQR